MGKAAGWRKYALLTSAAIGGLSGANAHAENVSNAAQNPADLPQGGVVAAGQASIGAPQNGALRIEQQSDRAIINWSSFDIGAANSVHFDQTSAAAAALNRVTGDAPSTLAGSLTATGSVLLVNPNGIGIAPGAIIDTGSFAASTLDIADADFLAGTMTFRGQGGSVVNRGTIRVRPGGEVALIGADVANHGVIQARLGRVTLAAGDLITLDLAGDGFLSIGASEAEVAAALGVSVEALRALSSQEANVLLEAAYAQNAILAAVNVPSEMRAQAVIQAGGRVVLAGADGVVNQAGAIDAQGGQVLLGAPGGIVSAGGAIDVSGEVGGAVGVLARNVLLAGEINANGSTHAGGVAIDASGRVIATASSLIAANGPAGGAVSIAADGGVFSSGAIEALGASGAGGQVGIAGADITLVGADVNVSGASGGGAIRIGFTGDERAPQINADRVDVSPTSTLRADATASGNGGLIGLWSHEETSAFGEMTARGGAAGGDGGFIEASSRGDVFAGGFVDASAPFGAAGRFSLDPKTIIISSATGSVFPNYTLLDPNPNGSNFGAQVQILTGGQVVTVDQGDNLGGTNAGAAYVFDSVTGELLTAVLGAGPSQFLGGNTLRLVGGGAGALIFSNFSTVNAYTLLNGSTPGGVISSATSLVGVSPGDFSGANIYDVGANFVIATRLFDNGAAIDAGAATWGSSSGTLTGQIGAGLSLVGTTSNDFIGQSIQVLPNGNYVVVAQGWDNGLAVDAGAVTWGSATSGVRGAVSAANSLVGSTTSDLIGQNFTVLPNGNYIVVSSIWDNGAAVDAGAVIWGSAAGGVTGAVSAANALVGTQTQDRIGLQFANVGTSNYVTYSYLWNGYRGAVTWIDGATGRTGAVSATNSLVGGSANDYVGANAFRVFSNGNYLVSAPQFNGQRGFISVIDGNVGLTGTPTSANSFVGANAGDYIGSNYNYLADGSVFFLSGNADIGGFSNNGALTWVNGTTVTTGNLTSANSVIGGANNVMLGWNGAQEVAGHGLFVRSYLNATGAITRFATPTTGVFTPSASNSFVGFGSSYGTVTPLSDGEYAVGFGDWNQSRGAATWVNSAFTGTFSAATSIIGATPYSTTNFCSFDTCSYTYVEGDRIGDQITALANGNFVVRSVNYNQGAGAVTLGIGAASAGFTVGATNSLVGTSQSTLQYSGTGTYSCSLYGTCYQNYYYLNSAGDRVGNTVYALAGGDYLVRTDTSDVGALNGGAFTFGDRNTGTPVGQITSANSLVGSAFNELAVAPTILGNGGAIVLTTAWNGTRGAATFFGNGVGPVGTISAATSLVGSASGDFSSASVLTLASGNALLRLPGWNNGAAADAGAVAFFDSSGLTGSVSAANSLVGSSAGDSIGTTFSVLSSGHVLFRATSWDNGAATDAGAVTFFDQNVGVTGAVSALNSLVGTSAGDQIGSGLTTLGTGNVLVSSTSWDNGVATNAGAITFIDRNLGLVGAVSASNSLVGTTASDSIGNSGVQALSTGHALAFSSAWRNGIAINAGAVTFINGNSGLTGAISAANSLVGTSSSDSVGANRVTLSNGNVVTYATGWDDGVNANAGAVTFIDAATGITGAVSAANSLIGAANSFLGSGGIVLVTPSTYAVLSPSWSGTASNAGAVTWGSALTGVVGPVTAANSLYGVASFSQIGSGGLAQLSPTEWYVRSPAWRSGSTTYGAFTPFDPAAPLTGAVTGANSLLGANPGVSPNSNLLYRNGLYAFGGNGQVTLGLTSMSQINFNRARGRTMAIHPDFITSVLNTGTAVDLQANTDIIVESAITANNPSGDGGDLSLRAGRSVLISASITTDGGDLTIVANERTANGVVAAHRDAGQAHISASGVTLDAGAGAVRLRIADGAGHGGAGGTFELRHVSGSTILVENLGGGIGDNMLWGQLSAASGATPIILALGNTGLRNNFGVGAINPGAGRYLIFANNLIAPGNLTTTPWYNTAYNPADPDGTGLPAGNRIVYSLAPTLTVTGRNTSRYYGDGNPAFDFDVSGLIGTDTLAGALSGTPTLSTLATAGSSVGPYAITTGLGSLASPYNYNVSVANGVLSVLARPVTVTADPATGVYGYPDPTFTYDVTSGSVIAGDGFTGALSRTGGLNVGIYAITLGSLSLGSNYNLSLVSDDFEMTPREVDVRARAQTVTYGDPDPSPLPYDVIRGSLAYSDAFTGALTRDPGVDVGFYDITQGSLALSPNYTLTYYGNQLEIEQRYIQVTADPQSRAYGDADPYLDYQITGGSLAYSDDFAGALTRVAGESTGHYPISQGTLSLSSNYDLDFVGNLLTIGQRSLQVTARAATQTYGDGPSALQYDITSGSLVFGDNFTGALTRAPGDNVSLYAILQGSLALNPNYSLTYVGNMYEIVRRNVTVTATSVSRPYGDANPDFDFTTSSLGTGVAVIGEPTSAALATDNVGGYAITQGTVTNGANPNYNITFANGVLTITPRAIDVIADNQVRDYGDPNGPLGFTHSDLGAGAALNGGLATSASSTSNVGGYAITQGTLTETLNPNYLISFTPGVLTVQPRPITITADDLQRLYGNSNAPLTFDVSDLGDGEAIQGAPTTTATATSNVGDYQITQGTLTEVENPNYDIDFVNGVLRINPRPITVTASAIARAYGDNNPAFAFTTSDRGAGGAVVGAPTTSATAQSNVGGYAITQGGVTNGANPNYTITFVNGALTVTPRAITITATNLSKMLGFADPPLTVAVTTGNLVNGNTITGAPVRDAGEGIGGYAIRIGGVSVGSNYALTFVNGVFTVEPSFEHPSPNQTQPDPANQNNAQQNIALNGPSGIMAQNTASGGGGLNDGGSDDGLCLESQDGVCVVGQ